MMHSSVSASSNVVGDIYEKNNEYKKTNTSKSMYDKCDPGQWRILQGTNETCQSLTPQILSIRDNRRLEPTSRSINEHRRFDKCDYIHRTIESRFHLENLVSQTGFPVNGMFISDINRHIMNDIVRFASGGQLNISADNVEELLLAADRFQMTSLVRHCCRYLAERLGIGNCISMVRFANHVHRGQELKMKGIQFLLCNFTEVFRKSPEFNKLTGSELAQILWSDHLNVKREETVLEAIVQWVSFDPQARNEFIPTLVSCLRVGLIMPQSLKQCVKSCLESTNHKDIHRKRATLQILNEVLHFQEHQMIAINPVMFAQRIPRDILIVVGGSNFGFPLNIVEVFDCRTTRWLPIYPHNFAPRSYHGLVRLEEAIYVVGGFNGHSYLSNCCKFLPSLMSWEDVAPMNSKRCYLGVAVLRDYIYAVGGYDGAHRLNTAERFNVKSEKWKYIAPMFHRRSDAGVAVLQDELYVCGGFNGAECVRTVEVYNADKDCWSPASSMLHRRSGLGVVTYDSCIYAVGGFDGIDCSVRLAVMEYFSLETMQWTVLSPMSSPRSNMAVVVLEDILYAVGGYNGERTTDIVECYDFASDSWYCSTSLSQNRSALSGCLVSSPPNTSKLLMRDSV